MSTRGAHVKIDRATQLKAMRRGQWGLEARWVQGIGSKRKETQGKKKEWPGRACKGLKLKEDRTNHRKCRSSYVWKCSSLNTVQKGRQGEDWATGLRTGGEHSNLFSIKGRGQYALTSHPLITELLLAFRGSTYVLIMLFCFCWDAPNGKR